MGTTRISAAILGIKEIAWDGNMPKNLSDFVHSVDPEATILLFGAGSSVPSHAPSVAKIMEHFAAKFNVNSEGYTLAELTDLIEQKTRDRRKMINELRSLFTRAKPTGGLLNTPLYGWKSIYTTNYDTLIEQAYAKKGIAITPYSSNFDFSPAARTNATKLYKLHGTIDQDVSLGHSARIILTGADYNDTNEYRNHLFDTLKADLADSKLIIIGHSLADPDIREIVTRAISLNTQTNSSGRIALLMYTHDNDRALLYEGKGLEVVFSGIDEFFAEMAKKSPGPLFDFKPPEDRIELHPALVPRTLDVAHAVESGRSDVSRMFNGWPASYADIHEKLTFDRTAAEQLCDQMTAGKALYGIVLGASGVGKTTAARQTILRLQQAGHLCWEHQSDHVFHTKEWAEMARQLTKLGQAGVVFIDDAHTHLHQINELVDTLATEKIASLKMILTSSRNNWRPRVKSPVLFKAGIQIHLTKLNDEEIERLITLVERNGKIGRLIENTFSGFSRIEKRRRLADRCEADMFVCMRNIFASEKFDDIILREYADLSENYRDIYRLIAALETLGVRVHRQMVIRLLGIHMAAINAVLESLTDIITEYDIDTRRHIYGWRGRHPVINGIVVKYKFNDPKRIIELLDKVIDNILPTYDIEIRSLIELCNIETGISRVTDKKTQNRLLRRIISIIPGQRVPRHRLIRNLIEMQEFDQAETEIRIFEKDFRRDGPVERYKINLLVARATRTEGILPEDRLAILSQARDLGALAVKRFLNTPAIFSAYCEVGVQLLALTRNGEVIEDALKHFRDAETRLSDPEITKMIRHYERRSAILLSQENLDLVESDVVEID